jgi:hypothetical protein
VHGTGKRGGWVDVWYLYLFKHMSQPLVRPGPFFASAAAAALRFAVQPSSEIVMLALRERPCDVVLVELREVRKLLL